MLSATCLVVGESLLDIVVGADGSSETAVGGSPMNVAVGLGRLDVPVVLHTQVGDDESGRRVIDHLRASSVEVSDASVRPDAATSTATARLDEHSAARYEFSVTWDPSPMDLPDSACLHVGSLGTHLRPGRKVVLGLVRAAAEADRFVSYDPTLRPALLNGTEQAWTDTLETAGLSTLVKISDEDARALRPELTPEAVARELLNGDRTELVILTLGAGGAKAFSEQVEVSAPAAHADLVDTVGAGDSFMAATLAVLWDWHVPATTPGGLAALDEDHLSTLLNGATAAAAVTCSRRGANPPTRQELPTTWPLPER